MLKLPLHLVDEGLAKPALVRTLTFPAKGKHFKGHVKALRDLDKTQMIALKLMLMAESQWMAPYLEVMMKSDKNFNPRYRAGFFNEYYYGLMKISLAHARALQLEEERLKNMSPFVRKVIELNGKEALLAQVHKDVLANVDQPAYGELSLWIMLGTQLFSEQFGTTATPTPMNREWLMSKASTVAFNDYVIHQLGGNLLTKENLGRANFVTMLAAPPEALTLAAE